MTGLVARLAPAWLRRPRPTARLRLTLFYSALFVASGACLLAIPYLLARGTTVGTITYNAADHSYTYVGSDGVVHGTIAPGSASGTHPPRTSFFSGTGRQTRAMVEQLRALAVSQHAKELHQLLVYSAVALAVMAVVSVLLGWLVAGRVLRPVRTINASARRISAHNLHQRLALDGPDDEFKELSATLDDLLERLDSSFESQRRFVANASHELRTPLTVERTLLQVALADPDLSLETLRGVCEKLLASGVRQERLIDALLTLASSEGGLDHMEPADLAEICRAALPRPCGDERLGVHLETDIRSAPLDGDPRLLERLVTNLVDNAVRHNVVGGQVYISTGTRDGKALLSVINTGPAVPRGEVDRLFQPFQRLDGRRAHHKDGHGLGLSIVRAIGDAHGATVTAESRAEGGLRVEVVFPAPSAQTE